MSTNAINEIIAKLQAMRDTKGSQPNNVELIVQKNLNAMMKELRVMVHAEIEHAIIELKKEIRNSIKEFEISVSNQPTISTSQEISPNLNKGIISVTVSKPLSNASSSSKPVLVTESKPYIPPKPIDKSKQPPVPPHPNTIQKTDINSNQKPEEKDTHESPSVLTGPMEQLRLEMIEQLAHLKQIMRGGKDK